MELLSEIPEIRQLMDDALSSARLNYRRSVEHNEMFPSDGNRECVEIDKHNLEIMERCYKDVMYEFGKLKEYNPESDD